MFLLPEEASLCLNSCIIRCPPGKGAQEGLWGPWHGALGQHLEKTCPGSSAPPGSQVAEMTERGEFRLARSPTSVSLECVALAHIILTTTCEVLFSTTFF